MFVGRVIKEVILGLKEEGFNLHVLQALIDPLATMGIGRACLATQDGQDILKPHPYSQIATVLAACRTIRAEAKIWPFENRSWLI